MRLIIASFALWLAQLSLGSSTYRDGVIRARDSAPEPISVAPSQDFDGNDGLWSSFYIQVGTPPQSLRVFISTAISAIWVIIAAGCPTSATTCPNGRGGIFSNTSSSSWREQGDYMLSVESNLNVSEAGNFGNDTIGLGQGSEGPTLQNQVVAGIATEKFWLGMLGLNPASSNSSGSSQPSFMTALKEQNLIPSLAYGYTAGNQYSLKTVLGSLTLGGYDSARFAPNDVTFAIASDPTRDLIVYIQSIQSTNSAGISHDLFGSTTGIQANIDSTIAEIWLPAESCTLFEEAFGLVYDSVNQLYSVNSTLHQKLKASNPNVTFTLGSAATGGPTVTITLPYAAFDLEASWPKYPNNTVYFPLQRATVPAQYTLGRTILQEAYLTVDYERNNFSISQAIFPDNLGSTIVPITPPSPSTTAPASDKPSPSSSSTSSSGSNKTIGVAVGVALSILVITSVIAAILMFRRRKSQKSRHDPRTPELEYTPQHSRNTSEPVTITSLAETFDKVELNTDADHSRFEVQGSDPQAHHTTESTTLLPPPHAFPDRSPSPAFTAISELYSHDQPRTAELHSPSSTLLPEMYAPGPLLTPIELSAEIERQQQQHLLRSSSHSSHHASSSPPESESEPHSPSRTKSGLRSILGSRPALHHRKSTLDSLPSLPSGNGGWGSPVRGEGELFSPVSPVGEGGLGRESWNGFGS